MVRLDKDSSNKDSMREVMNMYKNFKMGQREWPSYMLNYQTYFKRPIDYQVSKESPKLTS